MKNYTSRWAAFFIGFVMTISPTISVADDTEIFFNTQNNTSIRPNLLFILDNSGSMTSGVTLTVPTDSVYDPSKTYPNKDYDSDEIYYDYPSSKKSFHKDQLKCTAVRDKLLEFGVAKGPRLGFKSIFGRDNWKDLDEWGFNLTNADVDCKANADPRNFHDGNYLNWMNGEAETIEMTRMEVMQKVARNLADTTTGVNIGLMAFNQSQSSKGGRVLNGVSDVKTNANLFKEKVDALNAKGGTPLSRTLFEGMRYYQGGEAFLDENPKSEFIDANKNYKSPIELECQSNNIILLSDGKPSASDRKHDSEIATGIGTSCTGNCLDEIAGYMASNDMSAAYDGDQTITTYTVGFALDEDQLLKATATAGGGKYYKAGDAEQLAGAFDDIVRSVLETSSTFVAPGVAVNSFNRLNHFDALYYSVFEPDTRPLWEGNLKRYKISNDGKIVDANDKLAIDSATGFFKDGSQSWWAQVPDGKAVTAGGARSKLPDATDNRKVYTWIKGKDLTAADNLIATSNTESLTKMLLGNSSMNDTEQEELIRWIRGEDVLDENGDDQTDDARKFISDPLHSEPKLIVYGGTKKIPDTAVFFGDNQGYLHAVNGKTGESYFAFMPAELLKNQKIFMQNSDTVADRIYGMDGSVVSWVKNPTGDINAADGDHVYLYTGMRRGGRSYYALDVTDRSAPKAMWDISGGTEGFSELGQSWSTPVKSKINIDGDVKDVLFFAGGYDANQDDATTRTVDTMGRALYMVDAETGKRLWWAGPKSSKANLKLSEMKYSMPASPKVLDIDGDGLADQVYIGDMGGQIWRFDMNNGSSANSLASGGRIADFAGDNEASARRFYHTPDLSISRYWGKRYLSLMVGSGYQAHPLNKVIKDRAYVIRIPALFGAPVDPSSGEVAYATLTESDLFDTTDNKIGQGTDAEKLAAEESLADSSGWMIKLENTGEKILSSSIVVGGTATFTTYEPAAALSACAPSTGRSRLYSVVLRDGKPARNHDEVDPESEPTKEDRDQDVEVPGFPAPKLLRTEEGAFICVGTSCEPVEDSSTFTQTFWREVE